LPIIVVTYPAGFSTLGINVSLTGEISSTAS
jgi:hypothetical protein